jgi:hypothetical protein
MFMTATKITDHYRPSIVRKRAGEIRAAIVVLALCMSSLAQQLSSSAVQELAPGLISTGRGFTVTFSPDGHDAYFTARDRSGDAAKPPLHVYHSHFDQGQWQPAKAVAFSSAQWSDLDPFITVDRQRMFLISTRPAPHKDPGKRDMDIWYSESKNGDWGEPQWIAEVNSDAKEGSPSLDRQNNLYFFSDRGKQPDQNSIYVARWRHGHFWAPEKLSSENNGGEINAGPSDTSPWIAPNGKTLLFYSTRGGGYGKADLYVSFLKHGKWAKCVNLGPLVNTEDFEYNPSVSRDGRTLYFGRSGKIYSVPLAALRIPGLNRRRF